MVEIVVPDFRTVRVLCPVPSKWKNAISAVVGQRNPPGKNLWSRGWHTGTDFAVPVGTPIRAAKDGKVVASLNSKGREGEMVKILHVGEDFGSFYSLYMHLKERYARPGQQIKVGEIIGLSGNTGQSTGPHLHFQLQREGKNGVREFLKPIFVEDVVTVS